MNQFLKSNTQAIKSMTAKSFVAVVKALCKVRLIELTLLPKRSSLDTASNVYRPYIHTLSKDQR
jgi:hypothetical protein